MKSATQLRYELLAKNPPELDKIEQIQDMLLATDKLYVDFYGKLNKGSILLIAQSGYNIEKGKDFYRIKIY
jgi:hypothetical protein